MIVQHPAFKSVTHDVDNPEDWVAQGWKIVGEMPQVSTPGDPAPMPEVAAPKSGSRDKK